MQRTHAAGLIILGAAALAAGLMLMLDSDPAGAGALGRPARGPAPAGTDASSEVRRAVGAPSAVREALESSGDGSVAGLSSASAPPLSSPPAEGGLERVMGTFLTDHPDLDGLEALVHDLALRGSVVDDSVVVDPETGVVSGSIAFEGSEQLGEFEVDGRAYRVGLASSTPDREPFRLRALEIAFEEDLGGVAAGSTTVQHHPDGGLRWGEPGETSYVGWSVHVRESGTLASPLMMRAAERGPGGTVGHIGGEELRMEWDWDRSHYAPWLTMLSAVQPR